MDYSETQNCRGGSRSNLLTTSHKLGICYRGRQSIAGHHVHTNLLKVNVVSTGHLLCSEGRWKLVKPTKHTRKVYTHSKKKSNMHDCAICTVVINLFLLDFIYQSGYLVVQGEGQKKKIKTFHSFYNQHIMAYKEMGEQVWCGGI